MDETLNGTIKAVRGNLLSVEFSRKVKQNEVAYVRAGEQRLKAEVIRIRGRRAELQVYEDTRGLRVGGRVEFTGELLSVQLGPGMLGRVYDGLQNPLENIAEEYGFFMPRGVSCPPLDPDRTWRFEPTVTRGEVVTSGRYLGLVPEGIFSHRIMTPFHLSGSWTVRSIAGEGDRRVHDTVAELENEHGTTHSVSLAQWWPVKIPVTAYAERLLPEQPLTTGIRIIDTLFPVAKGGTYCSPGPFGAGKTVLQQITARRAEVDIVVIAACGERAGEVVDTLTEFPTLEDPRTGRSLMERTIIICNTSSMPVASREASVYTAVTIAEYYRQMGLDVLLLADSTSRWAQAMREISGRLEEIPGDEAYPAYLESSIARFYERAGLVRLKDAGTGSVTIGGTVSPAGGTFEEPVTQGTLKVVGAFQGLSRERASARRFPSIDPYESWSTYPGFIPGEKVRDAKELLARGRDVEQMMRVVGEEGISLDEYVLFLKGEFLDHAYLQQNAFDRVDGVTPQHRQEHVFGLIMEVLSSPMGFDDKDGALRFFQTLRQACIDWNYTAWESEAFAAAEQRVRSMIGEVRIDEEGLQPHQ